MKLLSLRLLLIGCGFLLDWASPLDGFLLVPYHHHGGVHGHHLSSSDRAAAQYRPTTQNGVSSLMMDRHCRRCQRIPMMILQSSRRRQEEDVNHYYRHRDHPPEGEEEEQEAFFRQELDSMQQMLNEELRSVWSTTTTSMSTGTPSTNDQTIRPPPPVASTLSSTTTTFRPLTHTAMRRRQVEIQLLASLEHSDAAVDELMNVWIYECPTAVREIDTIRALESHCESLDATIQTLQDMVTVDNNTSPDHHRNDENGNNKNDIASWPELHNRLALVLAMAGRIEEASACVAKVLALKPWHFEAQHLQVLLALQEAQQQEQQQRFTSLSTTLGSATARAIRAARQTLPPLTQPQRRRRWVQTAVRQAQERLAHDRARSQPASTSILFSSSPRSTLDNDDVTTTLSPWQ